MFGSFHSMQQNNNDYLLVRGKFYNSLFTQVIAVRFSIDWVSIGLQFLWNCQYFHHSVDNWWNVLFEQWSKNGKWKKGNRERKIQHTHTYIKTPCSVEIGTGSESTASPTTPAAIHKAKEITKTTTSVYNNRKTREKMKNRSWSMVFLYAISKTILITCLYIHTRLPYKYKLWLTFTSVHRILP